MRIQRGDQMAGYEAVELRDALRKVRTRQFHPEWLAEILDTDPDKLMERLQQEGLVEPIEGSDDDWRTTIPGQAFVMAKLGKPYKRAAADKAVAKMLEAAQEINDDEGFMFSVAKIETFGSYNTDRPDVSDVDAIIYLKPRWDDMSQDEYHAWGDRRCELSGRTFRTFIDRLSWPMEEVMRKLKGVSPIISPCIVEGVPADWERKVIFEQAEG